MGLKAGIWASRLGFGPQGWDLGLKVGFWASRLGLGAQGWDLGLKAGFWASRLGFGPQGRGCRKCPSARAALSGSKQGQKEGKARWKKQMEEKFLKKRGVKAERKYSGYPI